MAYTNGQADEESKQTLEKYGQDLTAKAMEASWIQLLAVMRKFAV